jgi:hypothetical protein
MIDMVEANTVAALPESHSRVAGQQVAQAEPVQMYFPEDFPVFGGDTGQVWLGNAASGMAL